MMGSHVRVAVTGNIGDMGVFVPAARTDSLMMASVLAAVRDGRIMVPVMNYGSIRVQQQSHESLGT